ncbi:MAG: exodeoxyribonuclease III, partial [Candidatus Omnitrophica bacterium]|nr:exodeoxyribonuclease III [Candidatus Omnitrophota bacterium]
MKLISWNVNGIRAILKKGFLEWLHQESPDILGIQETKAQTDQLTFDLLHPNGYHTYWSSAERKGYSGVAVFSKKEPLSVQEGLGFPEFDTEGRTLMLEYDDFILFNVYFPNGSSGNRRVPFKMAFYEAFLEKVETLRGEGKNIIVCGDVNTAHMEIDLSRPKENIHNTGFLPQERAWITKLLEKGYIDTFRHFNPNPDNFTW